MLQRRLLEPIVVIECPLLREHPALPIIERLHLTPLQRIHAQTQHGLAEDHAKFDDVIHGIDMKVFTLNFMRLQLLI